MTLRSSAASVAFVGLEHQNCAVATYTPRTFGHPTTLPNTPPHHLATFPPHHPYQPEQGLLVSVDSLLHLPKPPSKGAFSSRAPQPFYKAVYFMTPPGFYMQTPPLTSDTQFTIATDVKAPQKHQRFLDGLIPFRNVPYDRNAMLVLEIREINVNTKPVSEVSNTILLKI